jgi:hypothetical protein
MLQLQEGYVTVFMYCSGFIGLIKPKLHSQGNTIQTKIKFIGKVKVKVKLSLCITKYHVMKTYPVLN